MLLRIKVKIPLSILRKFESIIESSNDFSRYYELMRFKSWEIGGKLLASQISREEQRKLLLKMLLAY
jgi:hypothetical protein